MIVSFKATCDNMKFGWPRLKFDHQSQKRNYREHDTSSDQEDANN